MGKCPTPESLESLLHEQVSDAERERIEAHVEDCAACQETLHDLALTTPGPAPPDLLAALSEAPPAEATAEAEVFLDRLKQKALTPFPGGPQGPVSGPSESGELPDVAGYEILGELGRGAVGIVYRARHRELNRPVALKMILAGPHLLPEARQRFRVEAGRSPGCGTRTSCRSTRSASTRAGRTSRWSLSTAAVLPAGSAACPSRPPKRPGSWRRWPGASQYAHQPGRRSTATSSRPTSCWPRTGRPRSPTSGWRRSARVGGDEDR